MDESTVSPHGNHDVFAQSVVEIAILAQEYCRYLSSDEPREPYTLVRFLYSFYPLLFYKMTRVTGLPEPESHLKNALSVMEYEQMRLHLVGLLGEYDEIRMPLSTSEVELVTAEPSLAEIAADIYQEMYDLFHHYRSAHTETMHLAVAQCQLYFQEGWGDKLLIAMRWLHMCEREAQHEWQEEDDE